MPRYGLMLESEARPVGVILQLFCTVSLKEGSNFRCNLSSWYVEPDFRVHATTLVFVALRQKGVTYTNISAAPHTHATIEAQGFRRSVSGVFVGLPFLRRGVPETRIRRIDARMTDSAALNLPERQLLLDHAAMGCLCVVVEAPDGPHPFVFLPFRIRSGRVRPPARQLIYCRSMDDYVRFAGPLGRYLLWRGAPLVLHDANGPEPGLIGRYFAGVGPKFVRGPHVPRLGDLAYTERVIFGP